MHFLIFFTPLLFVETSVSGQDENLFTEYATTNENSINTVDSLGLGPIALGTTGNYLEQVANIDFSPSSHPDANLWDMSDETPSLFESNSEEGDGYSIDLLAGACASTDKLEARDKNELCTPRKANGLQIPTLPTLEELENKLVPLVGNEAQNPCPPQKKYHLCCDCDGWNNFMLCVDCTPRKRTFLTRASDAS